MFCNRPFVASPGRRRKKRGLHRRIDLCYSSKRECLKEEKEMKLKAFCHKNKIRLYLLLALIGLELLMSFSFLGYVHVEPISITFSYIPVMLAGALLGILIAMIYPL